MGTSGPDITHNFVSRKTPCKTTSYIWCRQANNKIFLFSFCSSSTQAPFNLPVFEAVVSTTTACILSNNAQYCKLSYTADEISNPVPLESPGTPSSCSKPGAVATTGRRSTFDLPVISGNIFESQ